MYKIINRSLFIFFFLLPFFMIDHDLDLFLTAFNIYMIFFYLFIVQRIQYRFFKKADRCIKIHVQLFSDRKAIIYPRFFYSWNGKTFFKMLLQLIITFHIS